MAENRDRGLIILGAVAAGLALAALAALYIFARTGAVLSNRPGAPLAALADSVFAAEYRRAESISLEPAMPAAERRRLRLRRYPMRVLLTPVATLQGMAVLFTEGTTPSAASLRAREGLLRLHLRCGDIGPAAGEATMLGYRFNVIGERNRALDNLASAYGLHRLCGDNSNAALDLEHMATARQNDQSFEAANTLLRQALALYRRLGEQWNESRVLVNLGCNRHQALQYPAAVGWYLAALDLARREELDDTGAMRNLKLLLEAVGPDRFTALCAPRLGADGAAELLEQLQAWEEPAGG